MPISSTGRIARRNVRIIFQKNEAYSDKYKNRIHKWTDYFSCFAYANTYAANESGEEVISEEKNITFETRWCPELATVTSTGFRILLHGVQYNIQSVDEMNYQRKTMKFTCKREVRQSGG